MERFWKWTSDRGAKSAIGESGGEAPILVAQEPKDCGRRTYSVL